jgi:hypothetical protein
MSLINGRVIFAAAKLALFYVALVAIELPVLIVIRVASLGVITQVAGLLAIPFAAAFVLLAVARRWGFVALWAILCAFWGLLTVSAGAWGWAVLFPMLFLPWSVLALPLWIIGQAGIPSRSATRLRIGPVGFSISMTLLICWAALLLGAQWFASFRTDFYPSGPPTIAKVLGWTWGVAPLLLSAYATRHAWRGTA